MPSTLDIRRRIRSVKSTRQITKAMELVSAAKMRKAQAAALASRNYASLAWELLQRVSVKAHPDTHALLRRPEKSARAVIVLITSNRGLIGAFNSNVAVLAAAEARKRESAEFVTIGKKGREEARKRGFTIAADFPKLDSASEVAEITPVAKSVTADFISGKYDSVVLVYPHFVSTLSQKPKAQQILPLSPGVGRVPEGQERSQDIDYLFEPSPDEVLEILLPRLVTMQIYQALLEANAAEHSARMVAMKNASDAASDLVSELTLDFNQIRQAAITKEISEIVSGSLAIQ